MDGSNGMQSGGSATAVAGTFNHPPPAPPLMIDYQSDRDFWLEVRRGLLMVTRAIERRYGINGKN